MSNTKSKYPWAQNHIKEQLATTDLKNKQKLDPTIVIDEETIKAQYIKRGGLVLEVAEVDEDALTDEEIAAAKAAKKAAADAEKAAKKAAKVK